MKFKTLAIAVLLALALWQWGQGTWIFVKARAAQVLIAQAWQQSVFDEEPAFKPWHWADTWPIARLQWWPSGAQSAAEDMFVLAGNHGESLAFGPGHLSASAQPGQGVAVISGHRDSHFAFLEQVKTRDEVRVQTAEGQWLHYRIEQMGVFRHDDALSVAQHGDGLVLVTCYPFGEIDPATPYRFVVSARRIDRVQAVNRQVVHF